MRAILMLCLSIAWPTSLWPQDYVSIGVRLADQKLELRGPLPGRTLPTHFSLTDAQTGAALAFGWQHGPLAPSSIEVTLELAPTATFAERDLPRFLQGRGFNMRANTARIGLALRFDVTRHADWHVTAAGGLGLSHSDVTMSYAGASLRGNGTTTFASASLRAARMLSDRTALWADLRYVASPAISIGSGPDALQVETSDLQLGVGLTFQFSR